MSTNIDETPERFARTAPEFQGKIKVIAAAAKLPALTVYGLWREYSKTCDIYDQSPVFSEFQTWYAAILTPTAEEEAA